MATVLRKRRKRVGESPLLPPIPFETNWNITPDIKEEELENLITDIHAKYKAWDLELAIAHPLKVYETRKEYMEKSTPLEKFQKEINEIQLSLWHRLIGIRSNKYSSKDIANTAMFLLLLKTHPTKCPKEKEYLKF
jgi:hypothetical protein